MAQTNTVELKLVPYSRVDSIALRARLNGLPLAMVMDRYYTEEALEALGCVDEVDLARHLERFKNMLIERSRLENPKVAELLQDANAEGRWSPVVVDYLLRAGESDFLAPKPNEGLCGWLLKRASGALAEEGIHTVADLMRYITHRGPNWYRPIRRMGSGKARAIERWLRKHEASLGALTVVDATPQTGHLVVDAAAARPVPLERIREIDRSLDGTDGLNRARGLCQISARNDLDALQAYLYRFKDKPKTYRAYVKELERFLLWCLMERQAAMSSIRLEDCEAYKAFLHSPGDRWVGRRAPRTSTAWRPFAGPLSPESQRYAVRVLRGFFEWLVRVRYLDGNPWATVPDPVVAEKLLELDIDKALPKDLWAALIRPGGVLDEACELDELDTFAGDRRGPTHSANEAPPAGAQYRLARAAILLMGTTGMRREEAAAARRHRLKRVMQAKSPLWELSVLGKRLKWRAVFLPGRTVEALQAHWRDRGHDFEDYTSERALLSPVYVPDTTSAKARHLAPDGTLAGQPFNPDGLYRAVKKGLERLAGDERLNLVDEDRAQLQRCAPHALRHTFATQAVAKEMPIDVLQRLLGHSTQQTTAIYVQAERSRSIEEVQRLFSRLG